MNFMRLARRWAGRRISRYSSSFDRHRIKSPAQVIVFISEGDYFCGHSFNRMPRRKEAVLYVESLPTSEESSLPWLFTTTSGRKFNVFPFDDRPALGRVLVDYSQHFSFACLGHEVLQVLGVDGENYIFIQVD